MASKGQRNFRKLLDDVRGADAKILRLFPTLDPNRSDLTPQARKGIETDLRVLIIAAQRGYVNDYLLGNEYGAGGDSRKRTLGRLLTLQLLARYEEPSMKGGRKFRYILSGKGLLLCSAFSRIFNSPDYVSSVKTSMVHEALRSRILAMYLHSIEDSNSLSKALSFASDIGFNFESIPEEILSRRLSQLERMMGSSWVDWFLKPLYPSIVDLVSKLSDEDVAQLQRSFGEILNAARSNPQMFKVLLTLNQEMDRLCNSSEYQTWLRVSKLSKSANRVDRLLGIVADAIRSEVHGVQFSDKPVAYWNDLIRERVIPKIRERLRQEISSLMSEVDVEDLIHQTNS
jgi:hypothetical protein